MEQVITANQCLFSMVINSIQSPQCSILPIHFSLHDWRTFDLETKQPNNIPFCPHFHRTNVHAISQKQYLCKIFIKGTPIGIHIHCNTTWCTHCIANDSACPFRSAGRQFIWIGCCNAIQDNTMHQIRWVWIQPNQLFEYKVPVWS